MSSLRPSVRVRQTEPRDFEAIHQLSRRVYPHDEPWLADQLASHLRVFPEGQFVAVDPATDAVLGMAASLIVRWDDYEVGASYRDFTDHFMFTNHDPSGRTLYAAEVMVDPDQRRRGIGRALYRARRDLVRRLKLHRIRAGARLRGYSAYAHLFTPEAYVQRVVGGEIIDPTLSFQLRNGFRVIGVVEDDLRRDPDSMGYAAIIESINHRVVSKRHYAGRDPRFLPRTVRERTPEADRSDGGSRPRSMRGGF